MQKAAILAVSLLIAIGLFSGSFDMGDGEDSTGELSSANSLNYESYSEGINTILFDLNGEINYTLTAQRQIQYSEELTEIEKPFIRLFQGGIPTWNVVADTGTITSDDQAEGQGRGEQRTIELTGNVEAFSIDDFGNQTVISTEALLVNPSTEVLTTELAVQMETQSINQSGIGMFANLKTDEVIFHRDIRGIYDPKQSN